MDFGEFLGDGLLQDSEGDADGLEVFGAGADVDVGGLEAGVVDDGILGATRGTSMKGSLNR